MASDNDVNASNMCVDATEWGDKDADTFTYI